MKKLMAVFATLLLLTGCATSKNKDAQPSKEQAVSSTAPTKIDEQQVDTKSIADEEKVVIDNVIYSYGKKRGFVDGNKIYIDYEGTTYVFNGDIRKLYFPDGIEGGEDTLYYDGLEIQLGSPSADEDFSCASFNRAGYYYESTETHCKTNSKDFVEFFDWGNGWNGSTGGDTVRAWHRFYMRKIANKEVQFEIGLIQGGGISSEQPLPYNSMAAWETYASLLKYGMIDDLKIDTTTECSNIVKDPRTMDTEKYYKILDDCNEKNDAVLRPIFSKLNTLQKSEKYLNALQKDPVNIEIYNQSMELINSFDIATSMPSVPTNITNEKKINWCHDYPNTGTTVDKDNLWVYSENFSGMDHAPTIQHVCQKNTELFSLNMDWDISTPHTGQLISINSTDVFPVSSEYQEPEFKLLGATDAQNPKDISVSIDGKIIIFSKIWNNFRD